MKILHSGVLSDSGWSPSESPRELDKNADSLALFPELVIHQVCDFNKQPGKLCCRRAADDVVKTLLFQMALESLANLLGISAALPDGRTRPRWRLLWMEVV